MTSDTLLTIVVPTFNRDATLRLLLDTLLVELLGLEDRIDVIIGDNASTDNTQVVSAVFQSAWPAAIVLRHAQNLGPDENFCRCIDEIKSRYFWIIGDDDLPKTGVIRQIVELLERENPDLVYLSSEWHKTVTSAAQGEPVGRLSHNAMSQLEFASRVNVWFTFISGMVISRDTLISTNGMEKIRRFAGSSLVQLGWVLGLLKDGKRFIHIPAPCMLAKAGNTSGYPLVTVFGKNFTRIVRETFGRDSPVATVMIRRNMMGFLPRLIWSTRFRNKGNFHSENVWVSLKSTFSGQFCFWLVLTPLCLAPKVIAFPFLLFTMAIARFLYIKDRMGIF